MIFLEPTPFREAVAARKAQIAIGALPKSLEATAAKMTERAGKVARVINARFAGRVNDVVAEILAGKMLQGDAVRELQGLLDELDYKPAEGKGGTVQDLSSNRRLELIVKTETQLAEGYGNWKQGQSDAILRMWPAQELYRAEERMEPRDWPERWKAAGGEFFHGHGDYPEGRMIALKDSPIWTLISRFNTPWAPFDFNSGMDVRDVTRDEAEELGLLKPNQIVTTQHHEFDDSFSYPDDLPEDVQRELDRELGNETLALAAEIEAFANSDFGHKGRPGKRGGSAKQQNTPIGLENIKQAASEMPSFEFLQKFNGEERTEHVDAGVKPSPAHRIHDILDPNKIDPSEWENWNDRWMKHSPEKIRNLAESKVPIPPVLVRGTLDDKKYRPQVIDGHHRTAAAIDAGRGVPVTYDLDTLIKIWKEQKSSSEPVETIRKRYLAKLKVHLSEKRTPETANSLLFRLNNVKELGVEQFCEMVNAR